MNEDIQGQRNLEGQPASGPVGGGDPAPGEVSPVEGDGHEPGEAAARIAELTGELERVRAKDSRELENLRVESSREAESLRAENAAQLEAYRELARSLPGVVPELVGGESLAAVRASVVTAQEAYSRIKADLTPNPPEPGTISGAGGGVRSFSSEEDEPTRGGSSRGVNLIYQALVGGKSGNLAR